MTADLFAQAITADPFKVEGFLPLGSWRLNVHATRRVYSETLGALLRQQVGARPLRDPLSRDSALDAELYLIGVAAGGAIFAHDTAVTDGQMAEWQTIAQDVRMLFTGWFRVVLFQNCQPHRIVIFIREPQYSPRAFRDHLFAILCKLLFSYGQFYLHAGALDFAGSVSVFVGQGSFGKSTVCLRLARAGATILSEDHVLFRRADNNFFVSGCQETARVTAKTESLIFPTPLDRIAVDGPGGPKKEFVVTDFFRAAPYVDFPFANIFFNHIGQRFRIQNISRQEAVLRLIYMTRSFYRHNHLNDLDTYLAFFSDLVVGRECYDLELSPDLTTLDQLVKFLQSQ